MYFPWIKRVIKICDSKWYVKQELRWLTSHLALFSWFVRVLNVIFSNSNQLQLGDIREELNTSNKFLASHRKETRMLPFSVKALRDS